MSDDAGAAYSVYRQAVDVAKAEYDALAPQLRTLQTRAVNLKRLIQSGSNLIGLTVEDKYGFGPLPDRVPVNTHKPTPTVYHGRSEGR
jgi:hypothetical protein